MGHRINITVSGMIDISTMSEEPSSSSLSIDAEAMTLVAAWREAISQMPTDMFVALGAAVRQAED